MLTLEDKKTREFPLIAGNNSMGAAGEELRAKVGVGVRETLGYSVFWTDTVLRSSVQVALQSFAALRSNWDSYGAPAPNDVALENAGRVLEHLNAFDLTWIRVVPSAEGGIGFCFSKGEKYADIEATNEGEIIGVRYEGMQTPVVIETDGTDIAIDTAITEIRNHLGA